MSHLNYMLELGGPGVAAEGFDDLAAVLFGDDAKHGLDGPHELDAHGERDPRAVGGWMIGGPSGRADDEDRPAAGGAPAPAADGESPADRRARIERLRHAVRVDAYDNELKLSIAVDRMMDQWEAGREPPPSERR